MQWALTDDPLPLKTAPDMLIEAFRVLVKNAVEAIHARTQPEDAGRLHITSRRDAQHGIIVTIRDNGVGISPANQRHIFNIGWSTKKVGMGFGLFWTKDYIEGLGGTISVESEEQRGTQFTITLPLLDISPAE